MNYKIKNIQDIEDLRFSYQKKQFDEISIDLTNIFKRNVLRWAIKYSLWNIKKNGLIKIIDPKCRLKHDNQNKSYFWSIKKEIFKSLKNDVDCQSISKNEIVLVKKHSKNYINNGISIGIVFSGEKEELQVLNNSLQSIFKNNIENFKIEVVVCGPSSFSEEEITNNFPNLNIRYLIYDNVVTNNRIMIGKKKNFLFKNLKYNISILMHTRILLSDNFLERLRQLKFDLLSPQVFYFFENKKYKYLSYHLLKDSNHFLNPNIPLDSSHFNNNYLYFMKNRYPYIDGGIVIINKNLFKNTLPYNPYVAWGEAEDVEMSKMALSNGHLVDSCLRLEAFSQTRKFGVIPTPFKLFFNFLLRLWVIVAK